MHFGHHGNEEIGGETEEEEEEEGVGGLFREHSWHSSVVGDYRKEGKEGTKFSHFSHFFEPHSVIVLKLKKR